MFGASGGPGTASEIAPMSQRFLGQKLSLTADGRTKHVDYTIYYIMH